MPVVGHGDRCNKDPEHEGNYEVGDNDGHPFR
jgi:hypothetical protein